LAYTFLVGLMPFLTRALLWTITSPGRVIPVAVSDVAAFGFVLHISMINELEHVPAKHREWSTRQNAMSLVFIALYDVVYTVGMLGEKDKALIDVPLMSVSCLTLVLLSMVVSASVVSRLTQGSSC